MRFSRLLTLVVAAAMTGAPSYAVFAEPATAARSSPSTTTPPAPAPAPPSDAERYAERESKDEAVADFEGGADVVIIGGSTLALVVVIVVLVVLL